MRACLRSPEAAACPRCSGATPRDYRVLPRRIVLVRHAESEGNVDSFAYTYLPDPQVPLVREKGEGEGEGELGSE